MSHFHEFLRSKLEPRGAKKAFAEALRIPPSSVSAWFGKRGSTPTLDLAVRIAAKLGVSLDYLATGEDHLAGTDPRVVELVRLIVQLKGDSDSLSAVEAIVRNRIAQKAGAAVQSQVQPIADEEGPEEVQAEMPPRG